MSKFWSMRRGTEVDGSAAVAAEEEPQLEPVELYTTSAMMTGLTAPHGRRLSDMLSESSAFRMQGAQVFPYSYGGVEEPSPAEPWTSIDTDQILFVMPPEHASPRQLRVHRRQRRVHLNVGDFDITGNMHLLPGTDVRSVGGTRFLPVTQALVLSRADEAWERSASVVLVNARHIVSAADLFSAT